MGLTNAELVTRGCVRDRSHAESVQTRLPQEPLPARRKSYSVHIIQMADRTPKRALKLSYQSRRLIKVGVLINKARLLMRRSQ